MLGLATLGTGIDPPTAEDSTPTRKCRVDREAVSSATAFADHLRVVWLTPAMDPLFNGPASERRRFLDRLVLAVDAQHSSRVAALDRALRSRNRLLEDATSDPHWLDAVEHETAELAVAVAAARAETVARLSAALAAARDEAISARRDRARRLDGTALPRHSATDIEDRYRALLKDNRARDAAAGRTLDGPHRTDLTVTHVGKNIAAADASTGEQKALLIRLVLAHAGLIKEMTGICAAPSARRGHRASRSGAPRRALRRLGGARRAGMDDRRGSCRFRRHCRTRARVRGAWRLGDAAPVRFAAHKTRLASPVLDTEMGPKSRP